MREALGLGEPMHIRLQSSGLSQFFWIEPACNIINTCSGTSCVCQRAHSASISWQSRSPVAETSSAERYPATLVGCRMFLMCWA